MPATRAACILALNGAIFVAACERPTSPDEPTAPTLNAVANSVSLSGDAKWGVRTLGTLGGSYSFANDLNNHSQVVGAAGNPGDFDRPFLWSPGRGMIDLGTLGGDHAMATGVNDGADVAGVGLNRINRADRAFLWTEERGMRNLGTLGGRHSFAVEVNDRRQVAGISNLPNGKERAFLWSPGQGMRDLGNLGLASNDVWAGDVNNATQVAGTIWVGGFDPDDPEFLPPHRAILWTPDQGMRELPPLGGENARALSVNEHGDAVGYSDVRSGRTVAALWRANGRAVNLGTLGGDFAMAFGVNDEGVVVGLSLTADGPQLPFVWTRESGMQPLPIRGIGGVEGEATAVNEHNEISGTVFRPEAPPIAVLWRPRGEQVAGSAMDTESAYAVTVTGTLDHPAATVAALGRCAQASTRPSHGPQGRVTAARCSR